MAPETVSIEAVLDGRASYADLINHHWKLPLATIIARLGELYPGLPLADIAAEARRGAKEAIAAAYELEVFADRLEGHVHAEHEGRA